MPRVFVPNDSLDAPNVYVMSNYVPEIAKSAELFAMTVYQDTRLPFRVVEGARLRTAQLNGCIRCQSFRAKRDIPTALARMGGDAERSFINRGDPEPDEAFYAAVENWRTSSVFSDKERLAIEYAERMGSDPHSFETAEEYWNQMHAHFEDAEIVELTLCIACWIGLGRANHALDIDPAICSIEPRRAEA
jgi:alkylhydroperoxidase family enzyme